MARITTNTTGTQPVIVIGVSGANLANSSVALTIPFVQDVTITNSTGVYSYTTFEDADQRKLSTPANNELSTNIVIDNVAFFGNSAATANSAPFLGILSLSSNKNPLDFKIYWAGQTAGNTDPVTSGSGFLTSIAAKTSPTAPVWVTPLNLAVDGPMLSGLTG